MFLAVVSRTRVLRVSWFSRLQPMLFTKSHALISLGLLLHCHCGHCHPVLYVSVVATPLDWASKRQEEVSSAGSTSSIDRECSATSHWAYAVLYKNGRRPGLEIQQGHARVEMAAKVDILAQVG